jgi:5-methyltetrahydrofolate--homocysteine methyltransferase
MEQYVRPIYHGILEGDMEGVKAAITQAIENSLSPETILKEGLIAAMAEVGRRFEIGEYFVPEMLVAARAMQKGLEILKPRLVESDIKPAGRIAIGTVKGDLHDIGKNLVSMMLEGAGFEIDDLGVDVSPDKFVEAARTGGVDIIAMSALLTTTMASMKATIDAIKEAGLADSVKVIIGGAPITEAYADEIGANGYAADAGRAARLALQLMGKA